MIIKYHKYCFTNVLNSQFCAKWIDLLVHFDLLTLTSHVRVFNLSSVCITNVNFGRSALADLIEPVEPDRLKAKSCW